MRTAGITPLNLEAKEGLALLNGTQAMLALLSLALREAEIAVNTADVAAALSLDALRGSPAAFDERIAMVRPYRGTRDHGAQFAAVERRQRDSRIASRGGQRPARAGRLQSALHAASTRCRARLPWRKCERRWRWN